MRKSFFSIFLFAVVCSILLFGCKGLRIEKQEPVASSQKFTGKYSTTTIIFKSGKSVTYIGELKMLDGGKKLYISAVRHPENDEKDTVKYSGAGEYNPESGVAVFQFRFKRGVAFQQKYIHSDRGFELEKNKNTLSGIESDVWLKIN